MASKLHSTLGRQAGYLIAYFGFLLLSISGLVIQGGILLFAGALCWFGVVFACFLPRSLRGSAKNLKDGKLKSGGYLRGKGERS